MLYSRLFAAVSFLSFGLALGGTLRLALIECAWRWRAPQGVEWPMVVGNARHFEDLAERQPELGGSALRAALRLNPRDSSAWIGLGLAEERDGNMQQAGEYLLEAEKVDRQYLPAWTSANFFFRRGNDLQFWRAAARAAAMSYDDPAPLIELADHREPNAIAALERLGDCAHLERGYLRFLIAQSRWGEGKAVAALLSARGDPSDRELLLNFSERMIGAKEGDPALAAWNGLRHRAELVFVALEMR